MTFLRTALASAALGALFAAAPAWASTTNWSAAPNGAHYANGATEPVCTMNSSSVSCTETAIAGIGNTNATVDLSVTWSATVTCTNRGGTTVAVKTQYPTDSSITVKPNVRNGVVYIPEVIADTPPTARQFESKTTCPNHNWTPAMVEGSAVVEGYSYTITFAGFTSPFFSSSAP